MMDENKKVSKITPNPFEDASIHTNGLNKKDFLIILLLFSVIICFLTSFNFFLDFMFISALLFMLGIIIQVLVILLVILGFLKECYVEET